jgi:hypothetical protein
MEIENTEFGTITMDGKTYEHDVVVRLSGEVGETEEKTIEEVLRHRAYPVERRGKICFRKGMRAADCWFGPNGQCASIAGSRSLLREKEL